MINIELEDIKEFSKRYNKNPENKKIERQITKKQLKLWNQKAKIEK